MTRLSRCAALPPGDACPAREQEVCAINALRFCQPDRLVVCPVGAEGIVCTNADVHEKRATARVEPDRTWKRLPASRRARILLLILGPWRSPIVRRWYPYTVLSDRIAGNSSGFRPDFQPAVKGLIHQVLRQAPNTFAFP